MRLRQFFENVVRLSNYRPEPTNLTPDVQIGEYVARAAPNDPDNPEGRKLDYWVYIEGPDFDSTQHFDIRRYGGQEPPKMTGMPDTSQTQDFTNFVKRVDTLSHYGQEKPPEVKFNPDWALWRKNAIIALARSKGIR